MTKKHTKTSSQTSGIEFRDIYDILMYQIEPDLVTSVIPYLPQILENESEDGKAKRIARYKKALETFFEHYESLMKRWKKNVQEMKKTIVENLEKESSEKTSEELLRIEEDIESTET